MPVGPGKYDDAATAARIAGVILDSSDRHHGHRSAKAAKSPGRFARSCANKTSMNPTQPESTARLRSALEPLQLPKHLRISLEMHKNPLRFPLHRFLLLGSFLQQPMEKLVRPG
jgi:hypothetical protein